MGTPRLLPLRGCEVEPSTLWVTLPHGLTSHRCQDGCETGQPLPHWSRIFMRVPLDATNPSVRREQPCDEWVEDRPHEREPLFIRHLLAIQEVFDRHLNLVIHDEEEETPPELGHHPPHFHV